MTGPQHTALREVVRDIRTAKTHPSASVRKAFENHSSAECENAARKVEYVISSGNGQMAYKIISEWHLPGGAVNVVRFVNGVFPSMPKADPEKVRALEASK